MSGTVCLRSLAALVGLLACAGCSIDAFTYTADRYGTIRGVNVSLKCRDTYEVLDRPDAATLLVVTNGVNEILADCFDGGPAREARMREVARIYLDEKTNRPGCAINGETEISTFHREFAYRCPADPASVSPRLRKPKPTRG